MLLAGQKVYVGPFLKKSDRPVDRESHFTNVYVKNLPDSVNDKKLNEMFSEHGSVTSAVVMKVPTAFLLLCSTYHTCCNTLQKCSCKTVCFALEWRATLKPVFPFTLCACHTSSSCFATLVIAGRLCCAVYLGEYSPDACASIRTM